MTTLTPEERRAAVIKAAIKRSEPYRSARDPSSRRWVVYYVDPTNESRELVKENIKSAKKAKKLVQILSSAWARGRISTE